MPTRKISNFPTGFDPLHDRKIDQEPGRDKAKRQFPVGWTNPVVNVVVLF